MNNIFRAEELITKSGRQYPVVGGRLRVAHENNDKMSITTELIQFESMKYAVVKSCVANEKGKFTGYGVASASKDSRLVDSLLELAETRAVARSLRFSGCGVEFTGSEELPSAPLNGNTERIREIPLLSTVQDLISNEQIYSITRIAESNKWDVIEVLKRILKRPSIRSIDEVTSKQASLVISRMKEALAA